MFQVPIIQDSAQLQTDTGRRRNQADANAYGAAEARALGAVSEGLSHVAEVAAEKQDELAEARARELDNQLSRRLRDRLYNTETGYFSTARGRNALEGRAQVESDIDAIVNELAASAPDERSRRLFADVGRRRATDALGDVAVYAARQADEYRNTVSEAAIEESISNAIAVYDDPVQRAAHMDTGVAEIQRLAERMGWDEQVRDNRIRQYQSDINARVIVQLAESDPDRAEAMFRAIAPSLTADERAQLSATMRGVQSQTRDRVAGAVWQAYANGRDPMALPEWEEFTTNPLLGREHETFNQYRRQRAEEATSGSGTSARVSEAVADRLEFMGILDNRALDAVAAVAEGRISVGEVMPRRPRPNMTRAEFRTLTGMTPEQAIEAWQAMNSDDLRRVYERRASANQAANSALAAAVSDTLDQAEPYANAHGIDVSGDGVRGNNLERRGRFRTFISRQVSDFVRENNRAPTEDERQIIINRALMRASGNAWAFEASPERRVVVRHQNIPANERRAIEAMLRSRGQAVNNRAVEQAYADFLQEENAAP